MNRHRRSVSVSVMALALLSIGIVARGAGTWQSRGPVAGTVSEIVVDVAAPGTILTTVDSVGSFISTNGGGSWAETYGVCCGGAFASNAGGIYVANNYLARSLDGITWESFPFPGTFATALAASPSTAGRLLAATLDGVIFGSEDGGQIWQRRFIVPGSPSGTCLRFDPTSDSTVYAGFGSHGLWKSSNAGLNWMHVQGDLPAGLSVTAIDVDPRDSAIFLGTDKGLFRSIDGGVHWTPAAGVPA
ncbi:MAG: WD40/YVTN/BNR-like repeat-containing protein, partial [bacterium]